MLNFIELFQVTPDDITFEYIKGRPMAPTGDQWDAAIEHWRGLKSDPDATYDKVVSIKADDIAPTVTWGTRYVAWFNLCFNYPK